MGRAPVLPSTTKRSFLPSLIWRLCVQNACTGLAVLSPSDTLGSMWKGALAMSPLKRWSRPPLSSATAGSIAYGLPSGPVCVVVSGDRPLAMPSAPGKVPNRWSKLRFSMYTTTIWPIFASFGSAAALAAVLCCMPAGVVQAARPIAPMPNRAILRT